MTVKATARLLGPIFIADVIMQEGRPPETFSVKEAWKASLASMNSWSQYAKSVALGNGKYRRYGGMIYSGSVSSFLPNGNGEQVWPDGKRYEGNFVNGIPHGEGKETIPEKEEYTGAFVEGIREGEGVCVFPQKPQGRSYWASAKSSTKIMEVTGFFAQGIPIRGKVKYEDGGEYKGDLLNWGPHGKGTYASALQEVSSFPVKYSLRKTYTGEFRNGDFIEGVEKNLDGSVYTGRMKDGFRTGWGTLRFVNGDIYRGEFDDGRYHGEGTFTSKDRAEYKGQFASGYFEGQGTCTWSNGSTYTGNWFLGVRHGQGMQKQPDGTVFVGIWDGGEPSFGTITVPNQGTYVGKTCASTKSWNVWSVFRHPWDAFLFDGEGTYTQLDGSSYTGTWYGGKKHGPGIQRNPDGTSQNEEWAWGKLKQPLAAAPILETTKTPNRSFLSKLTRGLL